MYRTIKLFSLLLILTAGCIPVKYRGKAGYVPVTMKVKKSNKYSCLKYTRLKRIK
jgi:hypothetical protein